MRKFTIIVLLILPSLLIRAQDKDRDYYSKHVSELIPDAQTAFDLGNYKRTRDLCDWYFEFSFKDDLNDLYDKTSKCIKIKDRMKELLDAGEIDTAKQKAVELLAINPKDPYAERVMKLKKPESQTVNDTTKVVPPVSPVKPKPVKPVEPKMQFVLKAGLGMLGVNYKFGVSGAKVSYTTGEVLDPLLQFPTISAGVYNIADSRFGGELSVPIVLGLKNLSALDVDAYLVYRLGKFFYPKLGLGYMNCYYGANNSWGTQKIVFGGGLTVLIAQKLALEAGVKYYQNIYVGDSQMVEATPGVSYPYTEMLLTVNKGLYPFFSIGYAF